LARGDDDGDAGREAIAMAIDNGSGILPMRRNAYLAGLSM
jgi:hypothetical protein